MSPRSIIGRRSWWRSSFRRDRAGVLDRAIAPVMEGLEGRTMLAYTDTSDAPRFKLIGDDTDEHIEVTWQSGNLWQFTVDGNPVGGAFDTGYWQIEIYGNGGNDTIEGSGNLNVDTYGVHDLIDGGPGDDVILGWRGDDTLIGGAGFDTVAYSYRSSSGVNLNLGNNALSMTGESDTISGFEGVVGSSFADTLSGSVDDDHINGGDGNDNISGLAGNDTISGGKGNDTLSGGGDQDVISYLYRATAGVDVDLATQVVAVSGETDAISSFEHAWGTSFDDILKGSNNGNSLMGGGGDDSLVGEAGNDTIFGDGLNDTISDGSDTVSGDAGEDQIDGEDGDDHLIGGGDNDVIVGGKHDDSIEGSLGDDTIAGEEGADTIEGDDGADSILGSDGIDSLSGGIGNDTLHGDGGGDILRGDDGNDLLYGGNGADSLTGGMNEDTLYGGLNSTDAPSGNDTLNGSAGNDLIFGEDGDDSLLGSTENDTLYGGSGNDTIDGGGGLDVARFNERWRMTGVRIRIHDATLTADGHELDFVASGTETIYGSAYADTITGGSLADRIDARGGADVIDGGGGNDTLLGGNGDDAILGSAGDDSITAADGDDSLSGNIGADTIDGGDGHDRVDYGYSAANLVVNLTDTLPDGAGADTDILRGLEDLLGGSGNDTLVGSANGLVDGRGGVDSMTGADAQSTLLGDAASGETFAFGPGTRLESPLTEYYEQVTVQGGTFSTTAQYGATVVGTVAATDVVVSANVTSPANQFVQLYARYVDSSNNYGARIHNGVAFIIKNNATTIGFGIVSDPPAAVDGTIRFEVEGGQLRLFLDDVLVASATDSSPLPAGVVGFLINRWNEPGHPTVSNFSASEAGVQGAIFAPSTGGMSPVTHWIPEPGLDSVLSGDFDGDGRDDIAGLDSNSNWRVGLSDGSGGFLLQPQDWLADPDWTSVFVGDFNGDGRADLAGTTPAVWEVAISTGSAFQKRTSTIAVTSMTDLNVLDLNGDGRDDLIARDATGQWHAAISDGLTLTGRLWGQWGSGTLDDVRVGDFNNDGRDDLVGRTSTGTLQVALSTGAKFKVHNWGSWTAGSWYDVVVGNFDGVGGDDLVGRSSPTSSAWQLALSDGFTFTNQSRTTGMGLEDVVVGDFNVDGNDDLLGRESGTRKWHVASTTGGGSFTTSLWVTVPATLPMSPATVVGDFTGTMRKAAKAFEEVYNNIRYEPYAGLMKGAQATADTGRGNAWDQAALLIEKLRAAGIEARFALGKIEATYADVQRWLAVKDAIAAETVLEWARLDPVDTGSSFTFEHAWVQAWLPGDGGVGWRNIDPSWKFRQLQPGIDLGGLPFDEVDYHSQVRRETAFEYYEKKVTEYLEENHPGRSLADVPYDGPIIAKSFDVVPVQVLDVTSEKLPTYPSAGTSTWDELPENNRHRVIASVRDASGTVILAVELDVSEDGTKPIVLRYVASPTGLIPQLVVGGEVRAQGIQTLTAGSIVDFNLQHVHAFNVVGAPFTYEREAGRPLAVGLGASQMSQRTLANWQARLNDLAIHAHDDEASAQEYQELLLAMAGMRYFHDVDVERRGIGGLRGFVAALHSVESGIMTGDSTLQTPEVGDYRWELLQPIFSGVMATDNPNGVFNLRSNSGNTDFNDPEMQNVLRLSAATASALEHHFIEELTNAESISTIKGIQWARSRQNPVPVYVIWKDVSGVVKYRLEEASGPGSTMNWSLLNLSAAAETLIQDAVINDQYTVTVPRDNVVLGSWTGAVWIEEGVASAGYLIMGIGETEAHGGAALEISQVPAVVSSTVHSTGWDVGDPVNVRSGSMSHDEQDVSVPAPGIPLVFARHYESSFEEDVGMGVGWLHTYSHFLKFDDSVGSDFDRVTWTTGQGNRHEFRWNGSAYVSPDELHGVLTRSGTEFLYREKDGTRFRFDAAGKLLFIKDRNDNVLNMAYNTIGQLTVVTWGTNGPSLTFEYDFATQKLIAVKHGLVDAWTFTYHPNNLLASATSPSSTTMPVPLKMEYTYYEGGLLDGLMKTITDVNDGGTHTYEYYPNRRAFRTTDSEGNQEFFSYDLFHNRTIYTNPRGHTSVHDFNDAPDRDRLVLHWGLDEPHDSNVADGKANDESGLGNHGTIKAESGETKWDGGVMGGAMKLYPEDRIVTDDFPVAWTPQTFTVSWWLNPIAVSTNATHTLSANDGWGGFRFIVDDDGAVEVGTDFATRMTTANGVVTAGEWQHFTFVYSGNVGRLYRNGVQVGEDANNMAAPVAWTKFKIFDLKGSVDDVRVYGRALAPEAIAALMTETEAVRNADRTSTSQVKLRQLVKRTTDELGRSETFEHDAAGNVTRHVSKDAIETRFVYESQFNQLVRTTVTDGATTGFTHDANGNVTGVVEGTTNLASNRKVFRSSTLGAGFEPEKAVDGSLGSRWESADAGEEWIYVDLGSSFSVSGVRLVWHAKHYATQYKVQLSNDSVNFTNADAFELHSTSSGDGGVDDLRGLSGTGRYLRILATASAAARYALYELEVYGSPNLAMGRPATAAQNSASATAAVDGKLSTTWSSTNTASGQYLEIDLGARVPINGFQVVWGAGEHATSYEIRGSDSGGVAGTLLRTVSSSAGGVDTLADFIGTARYIRIVPLTAAGSRYTIQEFEIYGNRHISRNRPVTASSNQPDAGKAVDGDTSSSSLWEAAAAGAATLDVDLGSVFHVAGARIHWYDPSTGPKHAAKDYSLLVSTDGSTWSTIYRTHDGDGAIDSITSLSGVGRYVRLLMTEPLDAGQAFALRDMELYAAATTMTYDRDRKLLVAQTAPKGNVANPATTFTTTYTYNALGQVETTTARGVVDPDNPSLFAATSYQYNSRGHLTSSTDARGFETLHTPDVLGNETVTQLPGAGSPTVTSTYYNGLLKTTTDPRNNTTSFDYDKMERTTRVVNPDGTYRTSAYDGLGNLTSSTDELGRTTRFFYDARNRLVQTLRADGTSQFTAYDGAGRVVSQFDPLGNKTTFTYEDDSDRVRTVTDAIGQVTTYTYDALGRLTKEQFDDNDTANNTVVERETSYEVDLLGRVTKTVGPRDPSSSDQNYPLGTTLYDAHGNVTTQVRYKIDHPDGGTFTIPTDPMTMDPARQRRTDYEYDAADRKTRELLPDPDGASELARPETLYEYDRAGNVRYVTQVVRENTGGTTTITLNETEYKYDELGRKTAEILPDPDEPGTGKIAPKTTYSYDVAGNLTGVIGPRGNTTATPDVAYQTTYAYDALNRQVSVTSPDPDGLSGTIFTAPVTGSLYDVVGNLVGFTDALGHTTRYEYDALGRKTRQILPDPDGAGDQLAPITKYKYDKAGNLEEVVSPRGNLPGANPAHFTTTYTYDALNRKTTETLPHPTGGPTSDAPLTAWTYKHGQLWKTTDALGRVTELHYDGTGRMIKEILPDPDGSGPQSSPTTEYKYNSLGELTRTIDPLGNPAVNATLYVYDNLGRKIEETLPDGDGNPATTVDRPKIKYEYDAAGNLSKVISPLGNLPTGVAADHTTTYTYDNLGRKLTETLPDPDGASGSLTAPQTQLEYDPAGNLVKVTDALGRITTHEYDRLERKVKTFEPDVDLSDVADQRPVTRYVYDANGNLTDVIDPLETASDATLFADTPGTIPSLHKTTTTYDALGRKIAETLADADDDANTNDRPTTLYAYDADGNLLSITDPVGNDTTYAYDNLGRKISETNELTKARDFTYDKVGNVLSITDRNGRVRNFTYDGLDRLRFEEWSTGWSDVVELTNDGTYAEVETQQPHGYTNGRMVRISGADQPEYNGLFGVTVVDAYRFQYFLNYTTPASPATGAGIRAHHSDRTIENSYDAKGRVWQVLDVDAEGSLAHRHFTLYDPLDRVKHSYVSDGTATRDYHIPTWDVEGRRTRLEMRLGSTTSFINDYTYDNLGRLTTLKQHSGGATDKRVDFAYNALGQYDTITRYADLAGSVLVGTSTYDYDDANRLEGLTHDSAASSDVGYVWFLDAAGRVTHESVGVNNALTDTSAYEYDNNHQMESLDGDAGGDETYAYDANGNRITSGHVIGDDNRLENDGTYSYQYDDEGNRTRRTHTATGNYVEYVWDRRNRLTGVVSRNAANQITKQVRYTYDAHDRLRTKEFDATGDLTYEFTEHYASDGPDRILTVDGTWAIKARHLHGLNLDEPLVTQDTVGAHVYWMLPDRTGSVRDLVVDSGGFAHVEYGGFGQVLSGTPQHFGFAGAAYDADTQLYHHDARWRDPNTNLFLGEDPAKDGSNWFLYARNNPVSLYDPTGLAARNIGGASAWNGGVATGPALPAPIGNSSQSSGFQIDLRLPGASPSLFAPSWHPDSFLRGHMLDPYDLSIGQATPAAGVNYLAWAANDLARQHIPPQLATPVRMGAVALSDRMPIDSGYDLSGLFTSSSQFSLNSGRFGGELPEDYAYKGFWWEARRQMAATPGRAGRFVANTLQGGKNALINAVKFAVLDIPHVYFDAWSEQTYQENSPLVRYLVPHVENGTTPVVHEFQMQWQALNSPDPDVASEAWANVGFSAFGAAVGTQLPPVGRSVNIPSVPTRRTIPLNVPKCFVAGTLVLMADGSTKAIEDVEEGDWVLADDPTDGLAPMPREVTAWHLNWTEHLTEVFVDNNGDFTPDGSLKATREHPFWTQNRGWIDAQDLQPGDLLLNASGQVSNITTTTSIEAVEPTFNLSVDGVHTFFVMAGGESVLVHNTSPGDRTWVVYQANDASGKVYTGRASAPAGLFDDPLDVLRYRYGGLGTEQLRGLDLDNARIIYHAVGNGVGSDAYRATRGLEHLYEQRARAVGMSLNKINPISPSNKNMYSYLAEAYASGVAPC